MSNDRVARLYMQDNIEVLCEKSVHDRILSDTAKIQSWERGNKLRVFEARLLTEADLLGINIIELRDQVYKEFDNLNLKGKINTSPKMPKIRIDTKEKSYFARKGDESDGILDSDSVSNSDSYSSHEE